ncbi:uncharacterized protein L969DRAFT_437172 [Mixia osmundae IAM 14324]|uniref:CNH domain-containing protein n=1 Tax=Mixia osmundae (strain CBS 9802 / IAM 14324 / JCM 22182 / KY 12970) TaxID=764103 RepID=G7E3A9_MIXOS|nr:uncharacterized protein L969DRAFT_437172 [Mixia osmundae IAM 14324]KEI39306.1 hypothetical protein L969DRAFT_437172 [Mixia osmundae IAM 14324]GAA97319.1 hypothetical protein E5Q_03997 [Mixia osmundae IAM 14324]
MDFLEIAPVETAIDWPFDDEPLERTASPLAQPFSAKAAHLTTEHDARNPPTYGELQAIEPPDSRFHRWRDWVAKRAGERYIDQSAPPPRRARPVGASLPLSSTEQLSSIRTAYDDPPRLFVHPSCKTRLTRHTALASIGSRFVSLGIESTPLCSAALPVTVDVRTEQDAVESLPRYILIGTNEGLYALDLAPRLSLNERSDQVNLEDANAVMILEDLGVTQLFVWEEPGSERGIVLGLVDEGPTRSLRMWPLASILNLVRWRTTSSASTAVKAQSKRLNRQSMPDGLTALRKMFAATAIRPDAIDEQEGPLLSRRSLNLGKRRSLLMCPPATSNDMPDEKYERARPLRSDQEWAQSFIDVVEPSYGEGKILFFDVTTYPGGRLYLSIATKSTLDVYESITHTDRCFESIACLAVHNTPTSATIIEARNDLFEQGLSADYASRTQLAAYVTLKSRSVAIRLLDGAVRELTLGSGRDRSSSNGSHGSVSSVSSSHSPGKRKLWCPLIHIAYGRPSLLAFSKGNRTVIAADPFPFDDTAFAGSIRPLKPATIQGRTALDWDSQGLSQVITLDANKGTRDLHIFAAFGDTSLEVQEVRLSAPRLSRNQKSKIEADSTMSYNFSTEISLLGVLADGIALLRVTSLLEHKLVLLIAEAASS